LSISVFRFVISVTGFTNTSQPTTLVVMHVFFSGIGGTGIGPLALVAQQAGFDVSGSDKQHSSYIEYLIKHGVRDIHIGQTAGDIQAIDQRKPIDWYVYSSAVEKEQGLSAEMQYCQDNGIRMSKRDEFLNHLLETKGQKMVAIAGTHGKTTTTAMMIWLMLQIGEPVSYSVGAKIGFGVMGAYDPASTYFIYEADEYDRNFLAFHPELSLITGVDWDHPDIYPTRDEYEQAFVTFLSQSNHSFVWRTDADKLSLPVSDDDPVTILDETHETIASDLGLTGLVNRQNAWLVANAVHHLTGKSLVELVEHMNRFPGVSRRFEQIAPRIYTDYAHTPEKIRGALQVANEVAPGNVVVVYEGLHNTRQHFIKDELATLFDTAKAVYVVPSYLAREDESLEMLTPGKLCELIQKPDDVHPAELNEELRETITKHVKYHDLVLCLSAGGGGSLDEWLRKNFRQ
jgi:UDP-N-acetylmuramate--alanine ligase